MEAAQAFHHYKELAHGKRRNDHEEEIYQLARCYYDGYGCTQNRPQAFKYFKMAAFLNHGHAQFWTGYCYFHGKGVSKDVDQGVSWFKKAILLEQPDAEEMMGFCYRFGTGVAAINRKFAREHYQKAVTIGNEHSVFNDAATHAAEMLVAMDEEEVSVGHYLGVP